MSWLYSQALVEEFSQATCSAGARSALSNTTPTPLAFWLPGRTTDACPRSRFGMTYGHLMGGLGAELLTWCREGFHVRTSAWPAAAVGLTENGQDSGRKWLASWAKYHPDTCSWKTAQFSLLEGSASFSETWPRSGLMRRGECYPLRIVEHRTFENESGLLPTLCTVDTGSMFNTSYGPNAEPRPTLGAMARHNLWPTLTVCGNYNRKGASATSGDGLITALQKLPTLCARDFRYPGKSRLERTGSKSGECLPQTFGGPLNPTWCEWFMGFPLEWTVLKPSGTLRFREWQQQHSPNLRQDWSKAA